MRDFLPLGAVMENMLTIRRLKPSYPCVINGSHPLWFTWEIGVILQHGEVGLLEVLTSQNQLLQTLMEELLSCESIDQLMCWTETMRIESPVCYPTVTLLSHMPPSKQPTSLMSRLRRLAVAAFRMTGFSKGSQ
jgi:hypothetical protein